MRIAFVPEEYLWPAFNPTRVIGLSRKSRPRRQAVDDRLRPQLPVLPQDFLTDESVVAEEFVASPSVSARRGVAAPSALDFNYELAEGESAVLAIRHPSGALTFHLPVESIRRGAGKPGEVRFSVTVHSVDVETGRRGIVSKAVKAVLIKVAKIPVDKVTSFVLPLLAAAFEKSSWAKHGLQEGWFKIAKEPGLRKAGGRCAELDRPHAAVDSWDVF